jgi:hypothetical protein
MVDLAELASKYLTELESHGLGFLKNECNKGELTAYIAFAISFPADFLALVDTYNVLK